MPAMTTTHPTNPAAAPELSAWVGRTEDRADLLACAPAQGLAATLDRDDGAYAVGTELPPLWHWLYFLPMARQSELGPDGHPKRGGFLPPVPLPRRMWAGSRLDWHAPLRLGETVTRHSRIVSVEQKSGRSGALVFVCVRHEYANAQGVALTEEHDIVYRDLPAPGAPAAAPVSAPQPAPVGGWMRTIVPDDVLLFRYSALTFNGHRIHYDRRYVTEVEGYPGLIVHGPLCATLMVDLVRRQLPAARLAHFSFKAVAPVFDIAPFAVCGQPEADGKTIKLWVQHDDGSLAMTGTATLV